MWAAPPPDSFQTTRSQVIVQPIQHATLSLETESKLIYVDPSPASLFSGTSKADLILITDIHGDHMDAQAISKLTKNGTTIIAPAAVAKTITQAKVLHNGEKTAWNEWQIEAVPMYNLQRGPAPGKFFHDKGRGNGYVLTYGGKRFYIAGDTEGIPEMKALKDIDVAFIPMNLPYTMPPEEAAAAVRSFHPKVVYPYHYRNGDKSKSDVQKFASLLADSGIDVRLRDWYGE